MADLNMQELSDEELAQLVQLGVIPEEQAALAKQQQQAQMLQQRPGPEGRTNGRVYTAANPLEFVGAGLQQYAGIRKEKQAMEKMEELRKQQLQGRQLYANKLLDTPYRRQSMTVPMPESDYGVKPPAMSF